jgi:signal transduction histidine kinase
MRRFTFWAVLLAVAVIVLSNVQGWLVLGRTRSALESELGDRLQAVAVTFAATAGPRWQPPAAGLLDAVMADNGLFNVFIVDENLRYLANARDSLLVDSTDAALELDAGDIIAALSGLPTQSRLYSAGGYYLKSAYAPLLDSLGTFGAVVGVEADARFFAVLAQFRRSLLFINILSLLAIVAVVLVSAGVARRALALEQAAGRASTLALLGQLSAAVAHDLKNPLAIIRATAERLKKRCAPDPAFDYIPEEVDRLSAIIGNYLSLGSRRPGTPEPIDIPALLSEVVADLGHQTRQQNVTVTTDFTPVPAVTGSRVELRQAFLNLLLNAVQAQPAGGSIAVAAGVETKGRRRLVVTVADTGPGIRPEDLRRVFEPFFTTREKGSGLGLFSVRRIVEAHGGRVVIDSRVGAGTTVTVRLPLRCSRVAAGNPDAGTRNQELRSGNSV